jgi:hypothetical protein
MDNLAKPQSNKKHRLISELSIEQRVYFRDSLRGSRLAALGDAEGFDRIVWAIERLGMVLLGREAALNDYIPALSASYAPVDPTVGDFVSLLHLVR